MIKFENRITIHKPADEVFLYAANPENYPEWNYFVTEVIPISGGGFHEGARFHQRRKEDEQVLEITALDPGARVAIRTVPPTTPELEREMQFMARSGSTEITDRWSLELGLPALLEGLAARRVKSAVRQNLEKLKILLEQGQVVLQDGRTSRL
jgi:uncharacterized membrane protein